MLGSLHAARESLLAEDAEEALNQIHPGGVRGGVMELHPWVAAVPATGRFVLVDVQIIGYDMQFAIRIGPHHVTYEAEEIHRSAPVADVSDHLAGGDFQGGNKRLRSVTHVFVGPTAGCLARSGSSGCVRSNA